MPLQIVRDDAPPANPAPKKEEKRPTSLLDEPALICRLTGVPVTATNPTFGTVYVSWVAYRMFERIGIARGYFMQDDTRSTKHVEMVTMASLAVRVGRDSYGNWLYVDEKENIMFVISIDGPFMLAVYDKRPKTPTEPRT